MESLSKVVRVAQAQAKKADYRIRVGAVIHYNGWIMGRGYNKPKKTHPLANTKYRTIHAEFAAILDTQKNFTVGALEGASIYVHRYRRDDLDGLAKPCPCCATLLAWVGIKDIQYSRDPK